MKPLRITFIVAILSVAACDRAAQSGTEDAASQQASAKSKAIQVNVGDSGFEPARIETTAGEPVHLVFLRTSSSPCGEKVKVPAHNIERDLPLNQPVEVTFVPEKAGEVAFTCGMDMLRGAIVVQ